MKNELLVKDLMVDLERAEDVAARIKTVREAKPADVTRQFYANGTGFTVGTISSWGVIANSVTNSTDWMQNEFNSNLLRQQMAQSFQNQQQLQNQQQQAESGFSRTVSQVLGQALSFGLKH